VTRDDMLATFIPDVTVSQTLLLIPRLSPRGRHDVTTHVPPKIRQLRRYFLNVVKGFPFRPNSDNILPEWPHLLGYGRQPMLPWRQSRIQNVSISF